MRVGVSWVARVGVESPTQCIALHTARKHIPYLSSVDINPQGTSFGLLDRNHRVQRLTREMLAVDCLCECELQCPIASLPTSIMTLYMYRALLWRKFQQGCFEL